MTGAAEPPVGHLMRLAPGLEWHNGYVIDARDQIKAEMHFTRKDVAMFLSSRRCAYGGPSRYRCLVGGLVVMFSPGCLVPCGDEL